jgi:hypothetical protein
MITAFGPGLVERSTLAKSPRNVHAWKSIQFVRKLRHARIRTTDFGNTHAATGHQ